jgi:transcription antitermination protein NusB
VPADGGRGGAGLSARSKARKRALDVLYEADLRGLDPLAVLADHVGRADPPIPGYAVTLVEGVCSHRSQIDDAVGRYSTGWSVQRMAPVDRNLLRLGAYELLFAPDIPDAVAIDEAVRLAKLLSGEEAPGFVNGILARVLDERRADGGPASPPGGPVSSAGNAPPVGGRASSGGPASSAGSAPPVGGRASGGPASPGPASPGPASPVGTRSANDHK